MNDKNQGRDNKRIIWVTGGKGGVGKSTFSRGLLDVLIDAGVNVAAFDGDPSNAQLFRYYQNVGEGVQCVDLDKQGEADVLLNQMEESKADVFLVDVAAGGSQTLLDLEGDIGLISEAMDMGFRFTVVSVMSRIKDSVNLLKASLEMTDDFDVQHVAVKNLYFGACDRFRLFDGSKTKGRLLECGGVVLEMPDLFDDTYELLDQKNLPFSAMLADKSFPRAQRSRINKWLKDFKGAIAKAAKETEGKTAEEIAEVLGL
ncbi:MAG: division plane positioning ATPase MipZ [Cyanobacteria bacterium J06623_5]